jgi:hypothetical protein
MNLHPPSSLDGTIFEARLMLAPQRSAHCDALSRPSPSGREPISAPQGHPKAAHSTSTARNGGMFDSEAALSATYSCLDVPPIGRPPRVKWAMTCIAPHEAFDEPSER